jgi:hypothetical protein
MIAPHDLGVRQLLAQQLSVASTIQQYMYSTEESDRADDAASLFLQFSATKKCLLGFTKYLINLY